MMNKSYRLLPFKFRRLNGKEIVVSEMGDFLILPKGSVQKLLRREIDSNSELYRDLAAKFIICDDYHELLIDVIANRLRTKKRFLGKPTALHIFVMTLRCNQKCIYCQASSQEKSLTTKDMHIKDLDAAIGLMLQSHNPDITMEFQGGESTLVPSLIEYAVKETERRNQSIGKCIKYVLCTNIRNISDELLKLCNTYNIFISTSLDGPDYLHDANRGIPGSYQNFEVSLQRVKEAIGANRVSPLMTTSEISLKYPREIVDTYRTLGFNQIFLRPLNPYGRATNISAYWATYFDKYFEFYKQALEYILDLNKKGIKFVEGYTALMTRKVLTPYPISFVDLQSPAGIINNVIVYNYDGYVYCSDESRMLAESGDFTFRLGHVTDSYEKIFEGEKARKLARLWATEYIAGCSDCAYFQYCGADPVRNYTTQKSEYGYRPTSLFCKHHKQLFDYLFTLIDERKDEVLPILKSWL
jgi:His-Xaa-Ser system radical SAM maturase HxsB